MPPAARDCRPLDPARGANPAPDPGVNGRAEGMALYKRLGRHHETGVALLRRVFDRCNSHALNGSKLPSTTHLFYGRVLTQSSAWPPVRNCPQRATSARRRRGARPALAGHAAPDEPILHEPKHGACVRVRARNERDTAPLRIGQPPLIYDSVLWSDDPGGTPGLYAGFRAALRTERRWRRLHHTRPQEQRLQIRRPEFPYALLGASGNRAAGAQPGFRINEDGAEYAR